MTSSSKAPQLSCSCAQSGSGFDLSTRPRIVRLARGELPLDTTELARFLIGKTLVHDVDGVRLSAPHRRDRGLSAGRCREPRLSRPDAAQRLDVPRARPRLRLHRLWLLADAERGERGARRGRRRAGARARADRGHRGDAGDPRARPARRPRARAGPGGGRHARDARP